MNSNAPPSSPLSASMMMQSPFCFKTCPSSQFSPSEDNRLLRSQTQTQTQTQMQTQMQMQAQTETDIGEFSNSLLTQIPRSLGSVSEDIPWDACSDFPYFNTKKDQDDDSSSFSSNSDTSLSSSPGGGEMGAQSPYSGPLESLSSLVASLPVKKGLSQFYGGKSQSFSCLSEARLLSDLAKPENPYAKRRRSFASFATISDNHRFHTNINKYNDDNDNDDDNNKNNTITINSNHNNNNNNKRAFATSTSDSTNLWKSCSAPARTFSLLDKLA